MTTKGKLRIITLRRAFNIRYATRYAALFIPSFHTHGEEGHTQSEGNTLSKKSTTRPTSMKCQRLAYLSRRPVWIKQDESEEEELIGTRIGPFLVGDPIREAPSVRPYLNLYREWGLGLLPAMIVSLL